MNYIDNENKDENISEEIENIESVEDENSIIENIVKTGDIELYDSLSIEEKTDYKIVRRLIIKYYFNRDFTLKVAKNYIDHKRFDVDDKEYIEILVLINKFKTYLNENSPKEEELRFKLEMFYNTINLEYLDLRKFDTTQCRNFKGILDNCYGNMTLTVNRKTCSNILQIIPSYINIIDANYNIKLFNYLYYYKI